MPETVLLRGGPFDGLTATVEPTRRSILISDDDSEYVERYRRVRARHDGQQLYAWQGTEQIVLRQPIPEA